MKKIFLNLGTIGLITAPAVTLISCSDETKTTTDDTQTGTPSTSKGNTDLSLSQKKLELANISIPVKETLQEGATLLQSLIGQYDEAKKELATLKTQGAASNNLTEINSIIINANAAKDRAIAYNTKVTEANNALAATKRTTLNSIKLPPKTQLLDGATLPTDIVTYDTAQTNLRDAQAVRGNNISALNAAIAKAEQAKRDATAYNAKVIDVNNNLASSKRTELTNISLPAKVALLDGAALPTDIVTYETAQSNLRDAQAVRGNNISALNAAIAKAKQAVADATAYNVKVTELNRGISAINSKKAELLALSLPEKKVLLNPSSATTLTDITTYEQASAHLITAKEKLQSNDMNEIEAGITAAKAAIEEAKAYNTKVDAENNKVINAKKAELNAIVLEPKVSLHSGVSFPANSGIVTYEQATQALTSAKAKANLPSVSYQQLLDAITSANQARTQAIAYNAKVNELNGDKAATLAAKKRQLANMSLPPKVTLLGTLHLSISQTYEHAQQTLSTAKSTTGDLDAINAAITNGNAAIEEAKIYNAAALKANNDLITNKKAELNSKSLPVKTNLLSGVNKPAGIISYEIAKTAFTAAKAKASLPSVSYQQLLDAISEANKAIADTNTYNTKVTEANKKFIDSKKAELATITLPAKVELITGATLPTNVVAYETAQTHLAEAKKVTSNDPTLLNAAITKAKQAKSDAVTYNTQATKVNNLLITSKIAELTQITLPTKVTLLDGVTAPSGVTSYEESQTAFNTAKEKLSLASPTIEVLTKAITDAKAAKAKVEAYNSAVQLANINHNKQLLSALHFPAKVELDPTIKTSPTDTYTQAKTDFDEAMTHSTSNDVTEISEALAKANNAVLAATAYNKKINNLNNANSFVISSSFSSEFRKLMDEFLNTLSYAKILNGISSRWLTGYFTAKFCDNLVIKEVSDTKVTIEFLVTTPFTNNLGGDPAVILQKGMKFKFEISNSQLPDREKKLFEINDDDEQVNTKVYLDNTLLYDHLPSLLSTFTTLKDMYPHSKYAVELANAGWSAANAWNFSYSLLDNIHATGKSRVNATNKLNHTEVLELIHEITSHLHLVKSGVANYDAWNSDSGREMWLFSGSVAGTKYLNADGANDNFSFLSHQTLKDEFSLTDEQVNSISYVIVSASSDWHSFGAKLNPSNDETTLNLILNNHNNGGLDFKPQAEVENINNFIPPDYKFAFKNLDPQLGSAGILSIQYINAASGYIFVTKNGELGYIKPDNSWTLQKLEVFKNADNSYNNINHIIPDGSGGFFVLGANGLLVDINADGTTKSTWKNCTFPIHDITSITFDSVNKKVFVGTNNGKISYTDGKTETPTTFSQTYLSAKPINSIVVNSDDTLYISNSTDGVDKIGTNGAPVDGWKTHTMDVISKDLGGADTKILSIRPDGHDGLWIFCAYRNAQYIYMEHIDSHGNLPANWHKTINSEPNGVTSDLEGIINDVSLAPNTLFSGVLPNGNFVLFYNDFVIIINPNDNNLLHINFQYLHTISVATNGLGDFISISGFSISLIKIHFN